MKYVLAITGASGSLYAQRLIDALATTEHHLDIVFSGHAREVAAAEIGSFTIPDRFLTHTDATMQVPFVSGSAVYHAMMIVPCSMGTLARIAHGYSDSTVARAADVFLKEKRTLILVPRETPWNLIQARNVVTLLEAGARILPAAPSFYGRPQTVRDVVDTVVARVLDQLGLNRHDLALRWKQTDET